MQIWKPCDYKWRHNDVITRNNENDGKMRTSAEPNKIYISFEKFWWELFKSNFYWIWAILSKVIGMYVKFTMTTHQIWLCQVTLASNSEKFLFFA